MERSTGDQSDLPEMVSEMHITLAVFDLFNKTIISKSCIRNIE